VGEELIDQRQIYRFARAIGVGRPLRLNNDRSVANGSPIKGYWPTRAKRRQLNVRFAVTEL